MGINIDVVGFSKLLLTLAKNNFLIENKALISKPIEVQANLSRALLVLKISEQELSDIEMLANTQIGELLVKIASLDTTIAICNSQLNAARTHADNAPENTTLSEDVTSKSRDLARYKSKVESMKNTIGQFNTLKEKIQASINKITFVTAVLNNSKSKIDNLVNSSWLGYFAAIILTSNTINVLNTFWDNIGLADANGSKAISASTDLNGFTLGMVNIGNGLTSDGLQMEELSTPLIAIGAALDKQKYDLDTAQIQIDDANKILMETSLAGHAGQHLFGGSPLEDYMLKHPELIHGDIDGDGIDNWKERQVSYSKDDIDGDGIDNGHDSNPFVNDNKYPDIEKARANAQEKLDNATKDYEAAKHSLDPPVYVAATANDETLIVEADI